MKYLATVYVYQIIFIMCYRGSALLDCLTDEKKENVYNTTYYHSVFLQYSSLLYILI